jgi:hypothetical protein
LRASGTSLHHSLGGDSQASGPSAGRSKSQNPDSSSIKNKGFEVKGDRFKCKNRVEMYKSYDDPSDL